jgi:hypothetical protein
MDYRPGFVDSVAFKASSLSKNKGKSMKQESSDDEDASDIDDEAMALFVRKFGKFMKKGYGARKRRDNKSKEYVRRCYNCKSLDYIAADCPYNSDNDEDEKKQKKEKKEKKKGDSYVVTWDTNASLEDNDKKSKKKTLASIAINNKPSIFDTSTCLMAKPTKVKYDDSDDDAYESDDCRSNDDDDDEDSKEAFMDMLENAHTCLEMKRKECKELHEKVKLLKQSFNELNSTHESLREDHEKLGKTQSKLEKAYSSLLKQVKEEKAKKEQVIMSCDVGLTCDILDESFYKPIVVAPTNPSCSTATFTSPLSDGFTCDASLMVKNETLKKEVNELTCVLDNAYGGDARLLKCLDSQRFSLNKEGLG